MTIKDCTSPIKNQLDQQNISYTCEESFITIQDQDQIDVSLVLNQFYAKEPLIKFNQIQHLTLSLQFYQIVIDGQFYSQQDLILVSDCQNVIVINFTVEQYTRKSKHLILAKFVQIDNLIIKNMILTDSLVYIDQNGSNTIDILFQQINNLSQDNFIICSFNAEIFLQAVTFQLNYLNINSNLNQDHTFILGINAVNGSVQNILLNDNLQNDVQPNIQIARIIQFYPMGCFTVNKILIQSLNYQVQQFTKISILTQNLYYTNGNFALQEITYDGIQQGSIPSNTVNLYIFCKMVQVVRIMQTNFQLIPFNQFLMTFMQGGQLSLENIALRNIMKSLIFIQIIQFNDLELRYFSIDYQSLQFIYQSLFILDSVYNLYLYELQIPIDPSQENETFFSRNGPPLIMYNPGSQNEQEYFFNMFNSNINLKNLDIYFANFQNIIISSFNFKQTTISNIYSPPGQNGGCLNFSNASTYLYLSQTIIEYCGTSQLGGGIYGGQIWDAQDTVIRNCFSKISGGGVVLSKNQDISILKNIIKFQNNKAVYSNDDYLLGFSSIQIDNLNYPQYGSFRIPINYLSIFQTNITQLQPYVIPKLDQPYLVYYQNPNNIAPISQFKLTLVDDYIINAQFMPFKEACGQGMQMVLIQDSYIMYIQQRDIMTINEDQCQQCNMKVFNQCYANYSSVKNGYWRSNYTVNQDQIYKCKISSQSCEGGSLFGDHLCAQGSVGVECMDCDLRGSFWGESYGSYGIFQCKKCGSLVLALIQKNSSFQRIQAQ
ncbi:hypothetical protein TTHERM_00475000 (macronuclear) [Tetrahymena thermophila SB210]|uniref:Uncharacterized protein n=1 Tax=Tetrahymena thermophila (strain SB210) TaxID=312017 RepID=I7LX44_TETTS|nr:hypothetical protein TTHERM_00475000 [Tetrahymena thermophila SB210]EAS03737.2 hypothetical protein TTHERM_00475000 [Tetrahymena thermophila SB210]|eukprot:XP_001023982.2 hypothetical protein TTHERM_00475000 [Tetrahymena thermophila SB210]